MKFVTSCIKWLVLCFWLFSGTVGILAARWNARQLDASLAELTRFRTVTNAEIAKLGQQLESADSEAKVLVTELATYRDQLAASVIAQESMQLEAAKWRAKFETICRKVEDLAGNAISVVAE